MILSNCAHKVHVDSGIYTLPEVARLTQTHYQRIWSWFVGRSDRPTPLLARGKETSESPAVCFHSLIDALVVARLRDYGVSMQYLRKVYDRLVREFTTEHPFSRRDLYTDGRQVFLFYADEMGEERLKEVLTNQHSLPQILRQYLKQIEYDRDTLMAVRWRIAEGIVIDPDRKYGKPIVDEAGVPASILAAAYRANNGDVDLVAEWYGVSQLDIENAVAFDESLARVVA